MVIITKTKGLQRIAVSATPQTTRRQVVMLLLRRHLGSVPSPLESTQQQWEVVSSNQRAAQLWKEAHQVWQHALNPESLYDLPRGLTRAERILYFGVGLQKLWRELQWLHLSEEAYNNNGKTHKNQMSIPRSVLLRQDRIRSESQYMIPLAVACALPGIGYFPLTVLLVLPPQSVWTSPFWNRFEQEQFARARAVQLRQQQITTTLPARLSPTQQAALRQGLFASWDYPWQHKMVQWTSDDLLQSQLDRQAAHLARDNALLQVLLLSDDAEEDATSLSDEEIQWACWERGIVAADAETYRELLVNYLKQLEL